MGFEEKKLKKSEKSVRHKYCSGTAAKGCCSSDRRKTKRIKTKSRTEARSNLFSLASKIVKLFTKRAKGVPEI
jgi:hypothetical protein